MRWGFLLIAFGGFGSPAFAVPLPKSTEEPLKDDGLIVLLIECLDDGDGEVRQNIAVALGHLGSRTVPRLIAALSHESPERRMGAAQALGHVRPPARSAIPALLKAMKDSDESVRRQVSYALSRIVDRDFLYTLPREQPPPPPLEPPPASTLTGGPR